MNYVNHWLRQSELAEFARRFLETCADHEFQSSTEVRDIIDQILALMNVQISSIAYELSGPYPAKIISVRLEGKDYTS